MNQTRLNNGKSAILWKIRNISAWFKNAWVILVLKYIK